jgi:hypothetical protein
VEDAANKAGVEDDAKEEAEGKEDAGREGEEWQRCEDEAEDGEENVGQVGGPSWGLGQCVTSIARHGSRRGDHAQTFGN